MPASSYEHLSIIAGLMSIFEPASVLDVGIGFGMYGFLARQYCAVYGKTRYEPFCIQVDGIEAFADYIAPLQEHIYSKIYIGDARHVLKQFSNREYDLVVMVDVLEHLSHEDGCNVISEVKRIGRNAIITTPSSYCPQGASMGNPYEIHRSCWKPKQLRSLGCQYVVRVPGSLVGVITTNAHERIRRYLCTHRLRQVIPVIPSPLIDIAKLLTGKR